MQIAEASRGVDKDMLNNLIIPLLNLYIQKNDFKKMRELFSRCLAGKEGLIKDKMVLGDYYYNNYEWGKALDYYKQALDYYWELGDKALNLKCFLKLGNVYYQQSAYDEARSFYEKALETGREIGDEKSIASALHQTGNVYYLRGEYDAALEQYQASLEIAEKIGDIADMAIAYGQLGKLHFTRDNLETALKYFIQAFMIFSRLGSPYVTLVQKDITLIQEKLTKDRFNAILRENDPGLAGSTVRNKDKNKG